MLTAFSSVRGTTTILISRRDDVQDLSDNRGGRPPIIGGEVSSTEETYEAVRGGDGVVLLAAGNAPLVAHEGVVVRPVRGVSPSELAPAWRRGDHRPLVRG